MTLWECMVEVACASDPVCVHRYAISQKVGAAAEAAGAKARELDAKYNVSETAAKKAAEAKEAASKAAPKLSEGFSKLF